MHVVAGARGQKIVAMADRLDEDERAVQHERRDAGERELRG